MTLMRTSPIQANLYNLLALLALTNGSIYIYLYAFLQHLCAFEPPVAIAREHVGAVHFVSSAELEAKPWLWGRARGECA